MIKFSNFIYFFLLWFVSPLVEAQSRDQLQQLQALQEASQTVVSSDSDRPVSDQAEVDQQNNQRIKEQQEIDQKVDFGFSGREDFLVAPQPKASVEGLKYFGYDYFNNKETDYSSIKDIPIPADYVLGPGDEIRIILFGANNKKYSLVVTRDGEIFMPEIGPVSVAGLTFSDAKATIVQLIENQLIGTQVSLTLGALRSINIFVLGEAQIPGMYTVNALTTLTNAIFASGGIRQSGSLRNIQLKRNGKIVSDFDVYQLLLNGDTSNDKRLMSNDVVFIPPITKKVSISGEVQRPAIYELLPNETGEDLLRYAGSLKAKADLNAIEIRRIDSDGNGFNLLDIDTKKESFSDLMLKDGDSLLIQTIISKINQAVLMRGHTKQPGYHAWKSGMRVLDLIESKETLLPMTDTNYVLIKREKTTNKAFEILQVNLQSLFAEGANSSQNLVLEERDELIFFPSQLNVELIQTISIDDDFSNKEQGFGLSVAQTSIK